MSFKDMPEIEELLDKEADTYIENTPGSLLQLRRNVREMPLGVASSFQSHYPYPLVIERGEGSYIMDVDGNRYLDLHGGFGANVFGHAHPAIVKALTAQIKKGNHFASPTPGLQEYSEALAERAGVEQIRFCNSGTEATMDAIRLARAYTGKTKLIKLEGSYHGHHDLGFVSNRPDIEKAGPPDAPESILTSEGIPADLVNQVRVAPFNNLEVLERIASTDNDIACLIMEPVLCNIGMVVPRKGYLEGVRQICDEHEIVLIFDQVKTAFTISYGGAVECFGVEPDLQCFGKSVGGGLPVGAFGGRAELMELITNWRAPHYGTFSGNPLVVTAGYAALNQVMTEGAFEKLEEVTTGLRGRLDEIIKEHKLPFHTTFLGTKAGVFLAERPPRDYREWDALTDKRLAQLYWLWMVNRGVWMSPGADEQWTLPLALNQEDCQLIINSFESFAKKLIELKG